MAANFPLTKLIPLAPQILPQLAIDAGQGQPPSGLTGTAAAVHALPALTLDFAAARSPALQLDLTVRPGVTPVELGTDLFRLCSAVNSLPPSQIGGGLTADGYVKQDGNVRMVMRFANPQGAEDRLAQLVSAINASQSCVIACPSISRCDATLVCAV
ncbi:MAG: hypothetical protein K8R36_20995 [Planctomycetales bacterium]|nr:hypothetical protein [Planctomycetales bacterium]